MIRLPRILWLTLLLLIPAGPSISAELISSVKYVTPGIVYIDAGSKQGVSVGDHGKISRDETLLGRVEISFVSEQSASCTLTDSLGPILVGDLVVVDISEEGPAAVAPRVQPESDSSAEISTLEEIHQPVERPAPKIDGRIVARLLVQDDRESYDNDLVQPSLYVNMSAANLLGTRYVLSRRGRMRQTHRVGGGDEDSELYNRIYEIALRYNDASGIYAYSIGRSYISSIGGVGAVDGLSVTYGSSKALELSAFGGFRTDARTARTRSDDTIAGLAIKYSLASSPSFRFRSTIAAVGSYHSGEIDREYLYERCSITLGSRMRLFQSTEFEIRRGWRKDLEGSALGISNVLINFGYSPISALDLNVGYDTRTLDRTYDNKDTPDSLFDDSLRQGFRAGISVHLPRSIRVDANGGIRTREGEDENTYSGSFRISKRNILSTGITAGIRFAYFQNRFNGGYQPTATLSSTVGRFGYIHLDAGVSSYDIKNSDTTTTANWFALRYRHSITRYLFASISGEMRRGDNQDYMRTLVEVGYRF